jgi:hypothetical protein
LPLAAFEMLLCDISVTRSASLMLLNLAIMLSAFVY